MSSGSDESKVKALLYRDLSLLVLVMIILLVSLSLFVVPILLSFFHSRSGISDSFFATGLASSIIGLVGFEAFPRNDRGRGRPSITEGLVSSALVVCGIILLAVSFGLSWSV